MLFNGLDFFTLEEFFQFNSKHFQRHIFIVFEFNFMSIAIAFIFSVFGIGFVNFIQTIIFSIGKFLVICSILNNVVFSFFF